MAHRLHTVPTVTGTEIAERERGPIVVVADADQTAGRLLAEHLSSRGLAASHTALGEEVLALARAGGLDVAIVDVALADMSGHILVSRLKAVDPTVRVLMTTSDYRPEFELRARQIGILHYAQKPIEYARLEAIVARAVGVRPRV